MSRLQRQAFAMPQTEPASQLSRSDFDHQSRMFVKQNARLCITLIPVFFGRASPSMSAEQN